MKTTSWLTGYQVLECTHVRKAFIFWLPQFLSTSRWPLLIKPSVFFILIFFSFFFLFSITGKHVCGDKVIEWFRATPPEQRWTILVNNCLLFGQFTFLHFSSTLKNISFLFHHDMVNVAFWLKFHYPSID